MEKTHVSQQRRYDLAPLVLIISAGLITTAIALAGVWFVQHRFRESVMSWYVFYVLPLGAGAVGLFAASGYLAAAYFLGVRMGKAGTWVFFLLQVLAYFAAQYVEFRSLDLVYRATQEPVGFWTWFHYTATSYIFEHGSGPPLELGPAGYVFRMLEIVFFAAGAALFIAALAKQPYCADCGRYRKSKPLASIFASHFVTLDENAGPEESEAAVLEAARTAYDALGGIIEAGGAEAFVEQVREHPPARTSDKLPTRLDVRLDYCPGCHDASMEAIVTVKRAMSARTEPLPRREVLPEVALRLVQT